MLNCLSRYIIFSTQYSAGATPLEPVEQMEPIEQTHKA